MYNQILVPTDGSAGMNRVIDHASNLADSHDAEVQFLYVVNTASFANLPMETSWENVTSMLRDEGETALQAAERRADTDDVVTALGEGPPSKEIVDHAREEGCDLIVMGTHGRGGINRLLLGSVAERVVRSAPVPVMTVRVGDDADEATGEASERNPTPDSPVGEAME
ncbi:universal stress protein [Natronomonas amylolytica]|uniref:universal stress protein n=1 Tax=Natronomonas amylolytica TaxID=3108498 RepID=UPI003009EFA2